MRNALDEDELIERIDGVHLLGIRSKTQVTAQGAGRRAAACVAIGAFCIGTDQIDLAAAAAAGIAVFNAPFSNTRSVVELALAEIIALTRRLTEKNAGMHAGVWDKAAEGSHEVRGRTPRHRRVRQHRHPAVGAGREPRHAGVLLRHRRQAGPGQRPALRHASTSCSRWPTWSRCTSTAGRATAASSARSSSPGCARAASS